MTAPHAPRPPKRKLKNEQYGCAWAAFDVLIYAAFVVIGAWFDLSFWSWVIILAIPTLVVLLAKAFWWVLTR